MNECTLPRKQDVELGARLVIKQSQGWSWIHQPADEHQLSPQAKARLRMRGTRSTAGMSV